MKRGVGTLLRAGMVIAMTASLFVSPIVGALAAIEPAPLPKSAPLYITGYQRSDNGQRLEFVELYNSGDTLLDLRDWTLRAGAAEMIRLGGGLVEPGGYVIVSDENAISNALFQRPLNASVSSGVLTLVPPVDSAFSETVYELKKSGSGGTIDSFWVRSATSTGSYSSSTTSFVPSVRAPYQTELYSAPPTPVVQIVELHPYASNCSPFDESVLCGDYVKLYNPTAAVASLDNTVLRTDSSSASRTTSNTISLDGMTLQPGEYRAVWLTDTDQRLNLTNSGGYVWLEDTWGLARYDTTLAKYELAGTKQQGYAWAKNGEIWQWTSTPNPNGANVFTLPVVTEAVPSLGECPAGKYRNPETNRCRTIEEAVNALATCPEGQERNATTNRCRSTARAASASLTPCKEGQERNPATNRCRSIASAVAELLPCDEGYERNPATNRCRKIQSSEIPPAAFPVEPVKDGANAAIAWWAVGGILILGAGYGAWEWRHEILGGMRKVVTRGKVE